MMVCPPANPYLNYHLLCVTNHIFTERITKSGISILLNKDSAFINSHYDLIFFMNTGKILPRTIQKNLQEPLVL